MFNRSDGTIPYPETIVSPNEECNAAVITSGIYGHVAMEMGVSFLADWCARSHGQHLSW